MKMVNRKNNGSALIALLIVIVIALALYMVDITAIFGPIDKNRAYEERPWFEEHRIAAKENLPIKQTGKGGKIRILSQAKLKGSVQRNNENRGTVEIIIEPNGLAKGHWQCSYEHIENKTSYIITASFEGNIDPTKNFASQKGINKKLLYFITKGKFREVKTDANGQQWLNEAPIYVVGWIDNDLSAKGKLFLMSNDPQAYGNAEYDWAAK